MATGRPAIIPVGTTTTLLLWTNRGLEFLWLITVILVPLAFASRDSLVSEKVIAYVEVPKIAVLRTLAGLMAALWLMEWCLQGKFPFFSRSRDETSHPEPSGWLPQLAAWLRGQPTRWVILAVFFFLGATVLSTVLSASFSVSVWGEVPGQDGYSAYTVLAYILLFGVIATHLKTKAQLWRLLGAIVVMAVLVSGYGVLQKYGHDLFDVMEPPGGSRVTSTMGNPVFAGAVLIMTIPISLMAATVTLLRDPVRTGWFWGKVGLWGLVLAVQLLGIIFTSSRGSWLGTLVALVVFLALLVVFVGWRSLGRAVLVLGLAAAFTAGVLLLPPLLERAGASRASIATLTPAGARVGGSVASELPERLASVGSETVGGSLSNRYQMWKGSGRLVLYHPWFQFDSLSLSWLRPVIGYGPELLRYTYLLESPAQGETLRPMEPNHAHNYFIHQAVETGSLGLLSSLGVVVALFLVGGYQLLRERQGYSAAHRLVLIGLLATLAGRLLEQMAGVNRVSDLTLSWVLLAMFVALPGAMRTLEEVTEPSPRRHSRRRSNRSRMPPAPAIMDHDGQLIWRLALVTLLIVGIGMLTWVKTINYPRAAVVVAHARDYLLKGNLQASLDTLDRAIELAPDVSAYYNHRATVYSAYLTQKQATPERGCSLRVPNLTYEGCLAQKAYNSNLQSVKQRPFYFRSRLALANSVLSMAILTQNRELARQAAQHYQEVVELVPATWPIRNQLARTLLAIGQPQAALPVLEESLVITKGSAKSAEALFIQGQAYRDLGELKKAVQSLERSLERDSSTALARQAHGMLAEIYTTLGEHEAAEKHRKLYQ